MEELPKPFGIPDAHGFYSVHNSNSLALETARNVVAALPDQLEYIALSGYFIGFDGPEDALSKMFDWELFDRGVNLKYHLLIGIDPQLSMVKTHDLIFSDARRAVEEGYQHARDSRGRYWHHGPLKTVTLDQSDMDFKLTSWDRQQNLQLFVVGSFFHSLFFSAVPLWEKSGLVKNWKDYAVTPFEYLQQFVFQFHREKPVQRKFSISRVTGDEAERFIID